MKKSTDVLVIGSGLAGLAFALKAAQYSQVLICTKTKMSTTNTSMAQGGIAAVVTQEDSFDQHIKDTIMAGAGLCDENVVKNCVESAPNRISDLIEWGVRFDETSQGQYELHKEGGHSQRRILHFADHTGQHIHQALLEKVINHPNIEFIEDWFAIDLITTRNSYRSSFAPIRCVGAYLFNKQSRDVEPVLAKATVLATGGAGKVYLYTSNWSGATGDGIAIGYRAGARVANLEFMQFHPTCLYHPHSRNFLISEALRGEGGILIDEKGQEFMSKYHSLASLAPRDIVARSIDGEMKKSGQDCVYLDMTHKSEDYLKEKFPVIFQKCSELGIDIAKEPIPVVPAAHYLCGGIMTDEYGQTDIPSLYAIGECAFTGLHGANRLASNSLLECLVYSEFAAQNLKAKINDISLPIEPPNPWRDYSNENEDELIVVSHMWDEIRRLMWNYVGIVRSDRRLIRAQSRLKNILNEFKEYYAKVRIHSDIIELRNIAIVADLSVKCALKRRESRGIHFNLDYPELSSNVKNTVIDPMTDGFQF